MCIPFVHAHAHAHKKAMTSSRADRHASASEKQHLVSVELQHPASEPGTYRLGQIVLSPVDENTTMLQLKEMIAYNYGIPTGDQVYFLPRAAAAECAHRAMAAVIDSIEGMRSVARGRWCDVMMVMCFVGHPLGTCPYCVRIES